MKTAHLRRMRKNDRNTPLAWGLLPSQLNDKSRIPHGRHAAWFVWKFSFDRRQLFPLPARRVTRCRWHSALSVRARDINNEMKLAAAYAIADLITDADRSEENIIPGAFDPRVAEAVANAVAKAARETGVARL